MKDLLMPNYESAVAFFAPFHEDLVIPFDVGWEAWRNRDRQEIALLSERTRANIVYDYIKRDVKNRFGDNKQPGINIVDDAGLVIVNFHDQALVRYKKLDKNNRPQNYLTTQQKKLLNQQLTFDFSMPTIVTIGYRLNTHQTAIQDITMACWVTPSRKAWSWTMVEQEAGQHHFTSFDEQYTSTTGTKEKPETPVVSPKSSPLRERQNG